ncbi:hypothetical protein [Mesorhizobium sp. A556]
MGSVASIEGFPPTDGFARTVLEILRERITALKLDLTGLRVVTEAATGAYACTAVIAAMAGAHNVFAVARGSASHGSGADAARATLALARMAGVDKRIEIAPNLDPKALACCDILTNSGHLRPITRAMIERLPTSAVIALMFEAWEFRNSDLDLDACRDRGIQVAGVNERHRDVAVFPFLGRLCAKLLRDAGMSPFGRKIALLCDNPFLPFIENGLREEGAFVETCSDVATLRSRDFDAVVVALQPRGERLGKALFERLASIAPQALVCQFWGDIVRGSARQHGFAVWPEQEPRPGHMGILLNALGPEPIVRLQTGGLRAAELVFRGGWSEPEGVAEIL